MVTSRPYVTSTRCIAMIPNRNTMEGAARQHQEQQCSTQSADQNRDVLSPGVQKLVQFLRNPLYKGKSDLCMKSVREPICIVAFPPRHVDTQGNKRDSETTLLEMKKSHYLQRNLRLKLTLTFGHQALS